MNTWAPPGTGIVRFVLSIGVSLTAWGFLTASGFSQTDNAWIGQVGANFGDAANWNQNRVPIASDVVVHSLDGSSSAYYTGATRDVDSFRIDRGIFGLDLGSDTTRISNHQQFAKRAGGNRRLRQRLPCIAQWHHH